MAREAWHHSLSTVTWMTRMELAWQSLVTTVRAERTWMGMAVLVVILVTFITKERVSLSWRVSPESHRTVNSLLSTNVFTQWCLGTEDMPGGCHAILVRWRTGVEHHLAVVSAHAGWPTHVQTQVMAATVIKTTAYGVKTVVSSRTRHICQLNSSGLEIQDIRHGIKDIIP